jgi:hypothetical protein
MRETPLRQRYTAVFRHLMRSRIHPALTSFADAYCAMLAHLFAYLGILALLAIVGTRLWDELLEKTETYRTSGIRAARTSIAEGRNAEIRLRSAKCCLASGHPRKIPAPRQASIGRARQGAGFHATFSFATALCDAVWPN